jgi:hypothetical protein
MIGLVNWESAPRRYGISCRHKAPACSYALLLLSCLYMSKLYLVDEQVVDRDIHGCLIEQARAPVHHGMLGEGLRYLSYPQRAAYQRSILSNTICPRSDLSYRASSNHKPNIAKRTRYVKTSRVRCVSPYCAIFAQEYQCGFSGRFIKRRLSNIRICLIAGNQQGIRKSIIQMLEDRFMSSAANRPPYAAGSHTANHR